LISMGRWSNISGRIARGEVNRTDEMILQLIILAFFLWCHIRCTVH
jgi:hypothetical protein